MADPRELEKEPRQRPHDLDGKAHASSSSRSVARPAEPSTHEARVLSRSQRPAATSEWTSDAHMQNHMDLITQQNKQLKARVEQLERENKDLKKSVFQLSYLYNTTLQRLQGAGAEVEPVDPFAHGNGSGSPAAGRTLGHASETKKPLPAVATLNTANGGSSTANNTGGSANTGSNGLVTPVVVPVNSNASVSPAGGSNPAGITPRKLYSCRSELVGHQAPVYCVQFSPTGKLLASGAFDGAIRVWSADTIGSKHGLVNAASSSGGVGTSSPATSQSVLQEHQMVVSDISWAADARSICSGSFDSTAKWWDVASSRCVSSVSTDGMVQSVCCDSADVQLYAVGTTHKRAYLFDRRSNQPVRHFDCDGMVNSVYIGNGYLILGDSSGVVKCWSLRDGRSSLASSSSLASGGSGAAGASDTGSAPITWTLGTPVSHAHLSRNAGDVQYAAVNCYDDGLRVYSWPNQSALATIPSKHLATPRLLVCFAFMRPTCTAFSV